MDLHLFEHGGENYLFFPRSARLYEVSDPAATLVTELAGQEFLVSPESHPPLLRGLADDDVTLYDELRELLHYESGIPSPLPPAPEQDASASSFHTCSIYLAQTCNMSCRYCWSCGGSFGKEGHLMEPGEVPAVVELISSLAARSHSGTICVNFYGGEPLLNFGVLQQMTLDLLKREERLGKRFRFTVDTNGSLLQGAEARFLARHFSHVAVSLDGREEIHNSQRPGKHGERTWRQIVKNIGNFPDPALLGLRATLTSCSDSYLQTFRQLASFGVRRIQLEYCHQPGYHHHPAYDTLMVPLDRQLAELKEFADHYIGEISRYSTPSDLPFRSNLLEEVTRLRRGNRATRPCGAGKNAVAISSRGEMFPCVAFVGQDGFRMEPSAAGSWSLHPTLERFQAHRQPPCAGCWLRYDCAGGCYAAHYDLNGETRLPEPAYCQAMKGRTEVYLYAMAQMQKKCPWHLEP